MRRFGLRARPRAGAMWRITKMSFDVTYCLADCANRKCELHKSHSYDCIAWKEYASYADRSKNCQGYKTGESSKRRLK